MERIKAKWFPHEHRTGDYFKIFKVIPLPKPYLIFFLSRDAWRTWPTV